MESLKIYDRAIMARESVYEAVMKRAEEGRPLEPPATVSDDFLDFSREWNQNR